MAERLQLRLTVVLDWPMSPAKTMNAIALTNIIGGGQNMAEIANVSRKSDNS